jgi:hypothetical protein
MFYKEIKNVLEVNTSTHVTGLWSLLQSVTWTDIAHENYMELHFYSIFNYSFNLAYPKIGRNIAAFFKCSVKNLWSLYAKYDSGTKTEAYNI